MTATKSKALAILFDLANRANKSAATFHSDFTKGIRNFASLYPSLTAECSVIYSGENIPAINGISVNNYKSINC